MLKPETLELIGVAFDANTTAYKATRTVEGRQRLSRINHLWLWILDAGC